LAVYCFTARLIDFLRIFKILCWQWQKNLCEHHAKCHFTNKVASVLQTLCYSLQMGSCQLLETFQRFCYFHEKVFMRSWALL
jgi:hypothetical protein